MNDEARSLAHRILKDESASEEAKRLASLTLSLSNEAQEVVRAFEKFGASSLLVDAHGQVSLSVGVLRVLALVGDKLP